MAPSPASIPANATPTAIPSGTLCKVTANTNKKELAPAVPGFGSKCSRAVS